MYASNGMGPRKMKHFVAERLGATAAGQNGGADLQTIDSLQI